MSEVADTTPNPPTGAQPGVFIDPYRAYMFKLEILGITEGHFTECSGFDVQVHPIRYREGGDHEVVHAIPGRVEYGDVTLKYGLTESRQIWDWFVGAVQGRVSARTSRSSWCRAMAPVKARAGTCTTRGRAAGRLRHWTQWTVKWRSRA